MNILVTGCAGSLGRGFVKYLVGEGHEIVGVDNSEWAIAEVKKDYPNAHFILDDFTNIDLSLQPIDVLIHCAAYKHLPLGEENVGAFIENNINKTHKLFESASRNNVNILFISSDKAVEPCNLYGYTKAIGEYLCKQYDGCIARCGNFLNSSGSVIPLWEKAIAEYKPLPVTDLNMKRYLIEIDDAVKQIWNGYLNQEDLIVPKCDEITLKELIDKVLAKHNKLPDYPTVNIGIRKGEKLQEKLKWDWE